MEKKFESLKEIIQKYFKKPEFEKNNLLLQIRRDWKKFVSKDAATHTKPYKIYQRKLYVAADNSIWISELRFYKDDIINKIKDNYTGVNVRDIHFIVR